MSGLPALVESVLPLATRAHMSDLEAPITLNPGPQYLDPDRRSVHGYLTVLHYRSDGLYRALANKRTGSIYRSYSNSYGH